MLEMIKSVNENKGLRTHRRGGEEGSEGEMEEEGEDNIQAIEKKASKRKKLKTMVYSKRVYSQFQDTDTSRVYFNRFSLLIRKLD